MRYVTAGDVERTKVGFVGLVGEVMANHSFCGTGRLGQLEVRWLPCACKGCFCETPGRSCEQAEFNTLPKDLHVRMATAVNTKSSDERIQERAASFFFAAAPDIGPRVQRNTRGLVFECSCWPRAVGARRACWCASGSGEG